MKRAGHFLAILLTAVCFYPVLKNGFILLDDPSIILENPMVTSGNWRDVGSIFFQPFLYFYSPLAILLFKIQFSLFGLNPSLFHATSLLIHLGCTFFAFLIFTHLTRSSYQAFWGTLFFAIHPFQAETIAWITGQRTALFGLFYLASLYFYLEYISTDVVKPQNVQGHDPGSETQCGLPALSGDLEKTRKRFLHLAFLSMVFSGLAKSLAFMLPLNFLLLDFYYERPLKRSLFFEKSRFFLGSFILCSIALFCAQSNMVAMAVTERFAVPLLGLFFYSFSYFFPLTLSWHYPVPASFEAFLHLLGRNLFGAFFFILCMLVLYKKNKKDLFLGIGLFFLNILPVIQVFRVGVSILASDHFMNVACLGLAYLLIKSLDALGRTVATSSWFPGKFILVVPCVIGLFFGIQTWNRCQAWKNSITLFSTDLQQFPDSGLMKHELGVAYLNDGNSGRAASTFEEILSVEPENTKALIGLGSAFLGGQQHAGALEVFGKAIQVKPDWALPYFMRGSTFLALKKVDLAITDFDRALSLDPTFEEAQRARRNALEGLR